MFRIFLISILGLLFFSSCNGGPTPDPAPEVEKPPVVLFLLDATSSLNDAEHKKIGSLATELLRVLPPGTKYGMYPIQIESARVPAILPDTEIPAQTTDVEERDYTNNELAKREKELAENLNKLYKTGDRIADDRRSCIINMLWFAEDHLKQLSGASVFDSNHVYRLVIISDMVEECGTSPFGEVRLNKQHIADEIKLADNFSQVTSAPNLSNVLVTVIFPLADESPLELSRRPSDRDLRAFWKKILTHCQVKDENLEWISTGQLPNWHRKLLAQKEATKQR
jgi:hypothetical protein